VLVLAIVQSDSSLVRFGGFIASIWLTLAAISVVVFAVCEVSRGAVSDPQITSLYQSSIRWNAFVALAAVEQLVSGGLEVMAVAIAVSIPVINVLCILVLAGFGPGKKALSR